MCNSAVMPSELHLVMFRGKDGETYAKTMKTLYYEAYGKGICVPRYFVSDGASIPRFFWRIAGHPFEIRNLPAAICHDYLYSSHILSKSESDLFFFRLLRESNGFFKSFLLYLAVVIFGGKCWRNIAFLLAASLALFLSACGTVSVMNEYDSEGRLVKSQRLERGIAGEIAENARNKTLVMWQSGWFGSISASAASSENITPSVKISAGKLDKGLISIHREHKLTKEQLEGIAGIAAATRKNIEFTAKGVAEK